MYIRRKKPRTTTKKAVAMNARPGESKRDGQYRRRGMNAGYSPIVTTCGGTEAPLPEVAAEGDGAGGDDVEDIVVLSTL